MKGNFMTTEFSLFIDTNLKEEKPEILQTIYQKLIPSKNEKSAVPKEYNIVKPFFVENSVEKQIEDKMIRFRFVQNFTNNKKTIEIFLKTEPDENVITDIKTKLSSIKEIIGYRMMKTITKVKIEINTI
jgi:hypothetical protein